jgi:DNA-binding transcriptional ArsR family regulator
VSVQLALRFDEVPITCEAQRRYHSISPCLAGRRSAEEQADALGLSYSAVCRWLRKFREGGMLELFPATTPVRPAMRSTICRRGQALLRPFAGRGRMTSL